MRFLIFFFLLINVNSSIKDNIEKLYHSKSNKFSVLIFTKTNGFVHREAIKEGGKLLNEKLNIGLSEDSYIRTKGYKTQRSVKMRPLLNPKKIKRNTNDMSFNYSQTEFKFEEQNNP